MSRFKHPPHIPVCLFFPFFFSLETYLSVGWFWYIGVRYFYLFMLLAGCLKIMITTAWR